MKIWFNLIIDWKDTIAVLGECVPIQTFDASVLAVVAGAVIGVCALWVAQCLSADAFRTVSARIVVGVALRNDRAALAR